ncbi:MAG: polysaccharide biosynthesis C-terminal domain-containing protein [Candidatus Gastranaerophilales bacterium]|nr:polysaccharide biosynthesis C-terminal domain-containing protein [Candidatus Gastranaerophilales bacterium]
MAASLFSELVTFVSGLILPRLILLYFGSTYNGLVGSITHFLGFSTVMRAGMGGAVRVALYKPLAENDTLAISSIMTATDKHMKKIGAIVGGAILAFAVIYPFWVRDEYNTFSAFLMVLIIGAGTFADNFFGIKYKIFLQANQKFYVEIGVSAFANILSTIVSVVLIRGGFSFEIAKLGAAAAALVNPIMLSVYVRRHYTIDWHAKADYSALKQRWDAFFHQVATTVNGNIDLVLITWMLTLKEVSVYTVHYMVANNIGKIVNSCITGIESTFGSIIVKEGREHLRKTFFFAEWYFSSISIVLYSVTATMISPFVKLYTHSVTDVNYLRPAFATVMVLAVMIKSVRMPYRMLVEGSGKFRETRNGAIVEVVVNLVVSVVMLYLFGVIGVLIGTLAAGVIRTVEFAVYCMREILEVSWLHIVKSFGLLSFTFLVCCAAGRFIVSSEIGNYLEWAEYAVIVTLLSAVITGGMSIVFYRQQVKELMKRLRRRRL